MAADTSKSETEAESLLCSPAPEHECKGDLLSLGSGCMNCRKCRRQMLELAQKHVQGLREERTPEIVSYSELMMTAGQVMGHALRYAKGDIVKAQTLLKIAASGAETVMQMESVRAMMSSVMKQAGKATM